MELTTFTPPERSEGDSFKPSENVGHLLIVKVTDVKHIDSTAFKPEGGDGIIADVCDIDQDGAVFRDILWMNAAIVNALKGYVDQTLAIKFGWAKSEKSGREYIVVEPAEAADVTKAQAHVAKGDPFAVQLATVGNVTAEAPF